MRINEAPHVNNLAVSAHGKLPMNVSYYFTGTQERQMSGPRSQS